MKYICSNCGYTNKDEEYLDFLNLAGDGIFNIIKTIVYLIIVIGLFFIPVIGWILALVLLFTPINNSAKKINKCPNCKAENCLVPLSSPRGQELLNNDFKVKH